MQGEGGSNVYYLSNNKVILRVLKQELTLYCMYNNLFEGFIMSLKTRTQWTHLACNERQLWK